MTAELHRAIGRAAVLKVATTPELCAIIGRALREDLHPRRTDLISAAIIRAHEMLNEEPKCGHER